MRKFTPLLVLAACAALAISGAWAQTQPAVADNNQNEEVNVNFSPDQGELTSLSILRTDHFTDQNDYVAEVFELQTEGMEVMPFLEGLVNTEGGNVLGWNHWDDPVNRTGPRYFVQVVCPPYQMPYVRDLVETYNQEGMTSHPGGSRYHFRVRHRLASDLAAFLTNGVISGDGIIRADNTTNTLFVLDSASDARRDLAVADFYDVPPRMVELSVQIVEVDSNDAEQLGLDWDAWKTSAAGYMQITSASRAGLGGEFFSFDTLALFDITVLAEFLNYLVNQGHATVVTDTNLTAINGQTAELESARRIPNLRYTHHTDAAPVLHVSEVDRRSNRVHTEDNIVVPVADYETDSGRADLTDVGTEAEGIFLTFTPTIGTETMTAHIECTVSSLAGQNNLDEPILSTRRVSTDLMLVDGEPTLIGAFDKETYLTVENGVPFLRRIPLVGAYLFQETTEELRETKLIVIATPRVDSHLTYDRAELNNGSEVTPPRARADYATISDEFGPTVEFVDGSAEGVRTLDAAEANADAEIH